MNKLTKLLPIILIVTCLLASNVQYTLADDALLIHGYSNSNYNGYYLYSSSTHPTTSSSYYSSVGQTVMLNASYQLGLFQVYGYIEHGENCNGTIVAQVYNNTDNELINVPSTDIAYIAESWNSVDLSLYEADTSPGWWNFYFDNITMAAGNYTFAVTCTYAGYVMAGTALRLGVDNTAPTDAGQLVAYYSSAWNVPVGTKDLIHNVYTFVDTSATPTPTPSATAATDSNATNALIETFVDILVPLILFLLPALILGWLTHWQKWPILIGLAIGAGLVYMFLGTQYLWLVVTVIIGIAGMAYSEFRDGG